jgi:hypothetical protein
MQFNYQPLRPSISKPARAAMPLRPQLELCATVAAALHPIQYRIPGWPQPLYRGTTRCRIVTNFCRRKLSAPSKLLLL